MIHPALLRRDERAIPIAAAAIVIAEVSTVSAWALRHVEHASALYLAAACDTALVGTCALWLLARRAGGLRALEIAPRNVIRGLLVATLLVRIALSALHIHARPLTWLAAAALETALFVTAVHAVAASRGADPTMRLRAVFTAFLPARAAAVLGTEMRVLLAAWRALRSTPIAPAEDRFTAVGATNVHAVIALLTLVELPAVHVLVAALSSARPGVHVAILFAHAYTLVWLAGDRRLLRETGHRVTAEAIEIELGCRWRATVPRATIRSVTVGGCDVRDPLAPRPKGPRAARITPIDPPNVRITCERAVRLEGPFGITRTCDRIDLYADDPARFVAAANAPHR